MENEKRTILFVNDEMRMGGVARVLNTLMAALPKDRYEIDLLILHKRGMLLEEVPQGVHVLEGTPFFTPVDESLDMIWASRDWKELFKKLRLLFYMKTRLIIPKIRRERKKILTKQYDVEVAAKEGFCTIFTASGDSRRKINWVLTDYSVCNYSRNHMPLVKQALRSIDLNIADSTQAMIAYNTVFKVRNSVTIHNLMDTASIERKLAEDPDGKAIQDSSSPNLISVVRFHPQKAVDRLLYASHEATKAGYAHTLYLVGGGEEENYEILHEDELRPIINVEPNYESVFQALEELVLHPEKMLQLKRQSVEYVAKHHDYVKVAKRYETLYQQLLP